MTTTITSDDLLTRLTKEELDELTAVAIEAGQASPVQKAIDSGLGEIKLSIDPEALEGISPEMLYRVWLSLAVPLLYGRLATGIPEKHLKEQAWAREFLDRARQGNIRGSATEIVRQPTQPATRETLEGL